MNCKEKHTETHSLLGSACLGFACSQKALKWDWDEEQISTCFSTKGHWDSAWVLKPVLSKLKERGRRGWRSWTPPGEAKQTHSNRVLQLKHTFGAEGQPDGLEIGLCLVRRTGRGTWHSSEGSRHFEVQRQVTERLNRTHQSGNYYMCVRHFVTGDQRVYVNFWAMCKM